LENPHEIKAEAISEDQQHQPIFVDSIDLADLQLLVNATHCVIKNLTIETY